MMIVVDPGVVQQEFLGVGHIGTPDWHWDPGGITYRFPGRSADYVLESTVDLAVEHVQFRSTPVANQFMGRLPRLSWHDIHTRDHRVVSTPWQELVGGGGIGRPPDGTLYGAKDSSPLCGAQRTQQSRAVVVTLLTHREIHFLDPSRRVWSVIHSSVDIVMQRWRQ